MLSGPKVAVTDYTVLAVTDYTAHAVTDYTGAAGNDQEPKNIGSIHPVREVRPLSKKTEKPRTEKHGFDTPCARFGRFRKKKRRRPV